MSDTKNKFYLTTPIYYVNARPHIGHAYTTIAADVIARRHRLLGDDTFFLTGTDEHGQKIQRSAEAAGIPPQQFADEVSASFQNLWKRMGITNDKFIRTTDEAHKKGVQKLFAQLQKNGFIELRSYTGQYCISDETFVDVPVGAPCPECGRITETVTEENYFFKLSQFQSQLIDLIESNTLAIQPDSRKNEVLSFLRGNIASSVNNIMRKDVQLNAEKLKAATDDIEQIEILKTSSGSDYVLGALKDLSISRTSVKWGIPVPGDEKHVIYVWLDALSNYMTAIGYGSDDPAEQAKFKKYWPADLHLVGKEIIRFHCVYWPAFLLALNPELAGKTPNDLPFEDHLKWAKDWLPKAITAHGWLLFEESKMSKSRGNIVRTETILDAFGEHVYKTQFPDSTKHEQDLFASDVLRYFLLREIPFGQDGSFSFDALVQRYNSDLANGYGNLVSRTLNLISQNLDGTVIEAKRPWLCCTDIALVESDPLRLGAQKITQTELVIKALLESEGACEQEYDNSRFELLTLTLAARIKIVDIYLSSHEPWKLAKSNSSTDYQKMVEVLHTAVEGIRIITALLYPILPHATAKVWKQLGFEKSIEQAAADGELKDLQWGGLKPGTKLGPLNPIFPRAPKELIQLMNDMESSNAQKSESLKSVKSSKSVVENAGLPHINNNSDATTHPPTEFRESPISSESATASLNPIAETVHPITAHHPEAEARPDTPQIAIDDFIKIDLRVAQIVVAERIPKADKLLRLEVDLGYERRQILSGIAQWYTPEELIGRRIVVIANLAPRKMRGLESHGMLLAASHGEDGKPVLATFGEDIALGSRLK